MWDRNWYQNNGPLKRARVNAYKATIPGQLSQARSHVKQDIERRTNLIAGIERELKCL